MPEPVDQAKIEEYFRLLQTQICQTLQQIDPELSEKRDVWERPEGGGGESRAMTGGRVFEKGGVNFSLVHGATLPPSATRERPQLAGQPFTATGVSVVIHPLNPFVPTTHMNVRYFTTRGDSHPVWWFGGGYDLTPYYPFREDAVDWHRAAQAACQPYGSHLYPRFKEACDKYFFLPHRNETRGIGGIFFDDFNELGGESCFAFCQSVGNSFMPAYEKIVERRKKTPFGLRERDFQAYRRGRYVEFNLLYDRGTVFGLQSKGRTESILMSLPPIVHWTYNWQPEPDSPEARLYEEFLQPQNWLETQLS